MICYSFLLSVSGAEEFHERVEEASFLLFAFEERRLVFARREYAVVGSAAHLGRLLVLFQFLEVELLLLELDDDVLHVEDLLFDLAVLRTK